MKNEKNKHQFAFFYDTLTQHIHNNVVTITGNSGLLTRLTTVVRLKKNDSVIFFDSIMYCHAQIQNITREECIGSIETSGYHTPLTPTINLVIPLLKKTSLEEALYSAVELGANNVYLTITQKVQRAWGGNSEYERLRKIVIAGAEQSKQFCLPSIQPPRPLHQILNTIPPNSKKIFFDPSGAKIINLCQQLHVDTGKDITLFWGPEGDLIADEKKMLKETNTLFYALTPTILRAQQAVAVGLGIIRSLTS